MHAVLICYLLDTATSVVPLASISLTIITELVCLVLTLIKTLSGYLELSRTGLKSPLLTVILANGEYTLSFQDSVLDVFHLRSSVLQVWRYFILAYSG